MKKVFLLAMIAMFAVGCLNVQNKTYTFKLNADGSGSGSILFYNIHSSDEEERDVSFKDFGTLVTDYLEGSTLEGENEGYTYTKKELFEKDGVLCGKVEFTFTDFAAANLYRTAHCDCAPILLLPGTLSETMLEHNGNSVTLGSSEVIEWGADASEISYKTEVTSDVENVRNLVEQYKNWKKMKK